MARLDEYDTLDEALEAAGLFRVTMSQENVEMVPRY